MDDTLTARFAANLDLVEAESSALADLAAGAWDVPVPTCPGWDVGRVVLHTSGTHRWATANTIEGRRVHRRELPVPPEGEEAGRRWLADGVAALTATLRAAGPDGPAWTFAGPPRAAWWARRMAQETALHRWDAAAAVSSDPAGFDPQAAADGVEEYLTDLLPRLPADAFAGLSGTLHVHATDAESEWVVDLSSSPPKVEPGHVKADTAVRGPASDLLLWLWNRQPADGRLEVFGDQSAVSGWRQVTI